MEDSEKHASAPPPRTLLGLTILQLLGVCGRVYLGRAGGPGPQIRLQVLHVLMQGESGKAWGDLHLDTVGSSDSYFGVPNYGTAPRQVAAAF
jgi:hypothetical protein